jgi:hypothetical protein
MNSTSVRIQLIQCQIEIAKAMLLCGELVEYDAKWLKNAKTVVRDKSGKFASKAAAIKEGTVAIAVGTGKLLAISGSEISALVKDPGFRQRAGLSASTLIGSVIGNLVAQSKIFPGLSAEIDKMVAQQEEKLEQIYGEDNTAIGQALRTTKLPQPTKDASIKDKMEFYVARHQAYDDALKSQNVVLESGELEGTVYDAIAKVAKASIPIAVGIGIALTADIAIPLLLGAQMSVGALAASSALSYGVSEAASFGAKKLLEKMGLSDTQKFIADIAVRILSASAVSGAVGLVAKNPSLVTEGIKKTSSAIKDKAETEMLRASLALHKFSKKMIYRKGAIAAAKGYNNLTPIKNPVEVKALQKIGAKPVAVILDADEQAAIKAYTGPSYVGINDFLRHNLSRLEGISNAEQKDEIVNPLLKEIELISRGLKRLPRTTSEKPFIRYARNHPALENFKPGNVIHEPGFMSCTTKQNPKGMYFSLKYSQVKFIIKPRQGGSAARDISQLSLHPKEKEVLFPAGSRFKIESIEKKKSSYGIGIDRFFIAMTEI